MERRLLLVFALTFLVIIVFQPLLKKYLPQAPAEPKPTAVQRPATNPPAAATQSPPPAPAPAVGGKQASAETEIVVQNDFYRITFTNRGAQVKSWVLKKYDDDNRKPLDLVNHSAAEQYGGPLSLWVYDAALRDKINSALFVPSNSEPVTAPGELSFEYADQDIVVRKTFRFDSSYVIHVATSVSSKGSFVTALPMWPAGFGDQATIAGYRGSQIEYQNDGTTEHIDPKKISGGNTLRGPFDWAGTSDAYFAAVFLPENPAAAAAVTLRSALNVPKDPQKPTETQAVDVLGTAVGNLEGPTSERMYVGPKSLQVLEGIHVPTIVGTHQDLRALVNFGFFGAIARPLFIWLRWTYEHWVPNWGWAIVIQTFIITVALLPLRISSMKSMLKMQRIQPQMKAIQEKYKKYSMRDPRKQEMNKELMDLQKKAGVNPLGGCLPMLIQLPFIWAYYKMLGGAIDLRHAPWLWIHDLSARDPYFILPIAMVLTMVLTQRMTPQAGMDPAQQRMMNWMMPLMMGFIFFNLAAGLNLYYAESNLISIAQQAVMNRTELGREMRELAAKRARKKDK